MRAEYVEKSSEEAAGEGDWEGGRKEVVAVEGLRRSYRGEAGGSMQRERVAWAGTRWSKVMQRERVAWAGIRWSKVRV